MNFTRGLRSGFSAVVAIALILFNVGAALANDPHADDRKQLLTVMQEVERGINAQSIDSLLALMTDDVSVTWLNAAVSRGKEEVKSYYGRMVGGEGAVLKKYLTKVSLGAPARFYGDIAVADGAAADEFFPHARSPFRLDSRWSATLRKIDGQWKITHLHLSSNVFTNALLAEAGRWVWFAGFGGAAAGLLLAYMFCLFRKRAASA